MQFKAYPSYRKFDDTVLNTLPETWGNKPFWSVFTKSEIANQINEQLLSVYLDKGVILYSDGGGLVHKPAESLEKYQLVDVNDFVMNNQQAWRGSVGVSSYKGIVSPAYLIFKPKKDLNPQFLKYQLRDKYIIDQFMISSLSVGTIQRQIKNHLLRKIEIPIPSISEQTQIATFLDHETAKIDNLIAKQEKLIELLEEQRKSIISHAVTKGLNPNAPMKDSGVEWLGEVPEHWYIFKSNKIFKQSNVRSYESDEQLTASQKYGVIPQSLYMKKEESKVVLALSGIDNFKHVDKNDFVISLRSFQGGIELCFYDGCVSPAYTVLKPNKVINYSFWSYLFKSTIYISVLNTAVDGIREGKTISYTNFGKIYINIPPLSEQAQIANYLDTETTRIDNLIAKQEKLIEKLKEYRSSIISHAVTGKIDVREFGA